ncbi:MAG: hydroxymethylbilane synthase, partial [Gammaproteobacteria bacterium]|nr:hydroxymethylbilane synthase [Gammaproteobacteria bacterium]
AKHVKALLESYHDDIEVALVGITTEGDRRLDARLSDVGGKGLFIKELEFALSDGRADIAIHSMKDVPASLPKGFCVITVGERADPRDAFVSTSAKSFDGLVHGARVGSSSTRRGAQLKHLRPDIEVVAVRGNVGTRLRKLDAGECHALMLAAAGLERLGLQARITQRMDVDSCVPAAGQGALAAEYEAARSDIAALLEPLTVQHVQRAVVAERSLVNALSGDCTMPLGAYATVDGTRVKLQAVLAQEDGKRLLRVSGEGDDSQRLGRDVADKLFAMGARELLS